MILPSLYFLIWLSLLALLTRCSFFVLQLSFLCLFSCPSSSILFSPFYLLFIYFFVSPLSSPLYSPPFPNSSCLIPPPSFPLHPLPLPLSPFSSLLYSPPPPPKCCISPFIHNSLLGTPSYSSSSSCSSLCVIRDEVEVKEGEEEKRADEEDLTPTIK